MRIVSLLPSTTEIVYALGLGEQLAAVTHECDFPEQVQGVPIVTRSALDHSTSSSSEIDAVVRSQLRDELSIYHLDRELLATLKPDLILTQALCEVCAVSFGEVAAAARELPQEPVVLSLEPTRLDEIFGTILAIGNATMRREEALTLVASLRERVEQIRSRTAQIAYRPRVLLLEWFDPLYGPGHWTPELIQIAGGRSVFGSAGTPSQRISWESIIAFAPEVIVLCPCGFTLERALIEADAILPYRPGWDALPAVRNGRVFAVDGNAYFSRPGPRIVESLELLASFIHPEHFSGWGPVAAAQPFLVQRVS
jgi:iron complex transport system substrate-binding protein